jgi:hypothetical protein
METTKTTVFKLTRNDIQEILYSAFVQQLKRKEINAFFQVEDVVLNISGDMTDVWAELTIKETE